ncbi:HAD family hydrolase [Desulfatitalea tepidiphila]|uniref:HAD family hydrolase n=1 Tax=Desulfatitalea tepidiphila TaxID=1185843 RepID=UPI000975D613|nr:HAD family hydrolase [Desulfatitalea tepidiphila]
MNVIPKQLITPYLKPLEPLPTNVTPEGRLTPPIRCLLCDIYGTLLISASGDVGQSSQQKWPIHQMTRLLERYAIPMTAERLIEELHGAIKEAHHKARSMGIECPEVCIENIWQSLLPLKSSEEITGLAVEFEMLLNPVWPMPHLSELLTACRERNILLGIISNAQFFTLHLLELLTGSPMTRLGFKKELTFLSYRHGIAKPADGLFRMASDRLKKLGIAPEHAVYMGNDMRKDIAPAKRNAFQTILFAGDARSLRLNSETNSIETSDPDLVVTDLLQVIPFLDPIL